MKILLTGASSFSGFWFAKILAGAGHEVHAPLLRKEEEYTSLRKERVDALKKVAYLYFDTPFGSEKFLEVIQSHQQWGRFCHHGAVVKEYTSDHFDYFEALKGNTAQLEMVLLSLKQRGCHHLVLTGSLFEPGEGIGDKPLGALSRYGLSKGLTSMVFEYFAAQFCFSFGKFVIPNPFGPYEEPRFTTFLIENWVHGKTPLVKTPNYIRDNIHITSLALSYKKFVTTLPNVPGVLKCTPTGYQETQGEFAKRFAAEMEKTLNIHCPLDLIKEHPFHQPRVRVNRTTASPSGWSEKEAWTTLGSYYRERYGI